MEYIFNSASSNIEYDQKDIINNLDKGLISVIFDSKQKYMDESYVPVTLSVSLENNMNIEQKAEVIASLQIILKEVFHQFYNSPIEFVDVTQYNILNSIQKTILKDEEDIYIFTPYTTFRTLLYEDSRYSNNININKYVGYTLLSNSLLTRYVVENLKYDNIKYINTPLGYISIIPIFSKDFARRKLDISQSEIDFTLQNLEISKESEEIIFRVNDNITQLIKDGYFAYSIGIHDLEDIEIIQELCILYDISIIDHKDPSILICRTEVDFLTTPEEWIRYNLPVIKSGQFPTFTFSFDFSFFNDYIRLYGASFRDIILKYVSHMAYAKLSDDHPITAPYITSIHINEDLSITVALPSYSLIKQLKNYIIEYLNNGISYNDENKLSGAWNIETCKNLREGILRRWIVQQVDPDAYPMIFKSSDENGTEVLIHRSPLAITYPSRFDFSDNNLNIEEYKLMEELRNFYLKCHDNIEAVTLENINEMNLDELLNLIPIEEKGKFYCFSNSTIERLSKLENPLTRRPLTFKTIQTKKYLEEGLRGLFDIGPLFGLYEFMPVSQKEKIDIGIIKITREYVDENRRDLVGNIFLVEVLFEDETTTPLFEISLPMIELHRIGELREYVNKLWYEGYFLSDWATAVVKYLNISRIEISTFHKVKSLRPKSLVILINSPVLLHAADSIFDGNLTLEMLKNATI